MALKDWVGMGKVGVYHNQKRYGDSIQVYDDTYMHGNTPIKRYSVKTQMGLKGGRPKHFDTKASALKFAKSYMRRH